MKVLVAYATRHGATRGIAERLARVLDDEGLEVTLHRLGDEVDPARYDAFVIGGAAYAFHWMKEATTFVRRHRDVLAVRPTWLFSSGPVGTETVDAQGRDIAEASRPKEFAELETLVRPHDERVFFGAWDPTAPPADLADRVMQGFMRILPAMKGALPAGDFRDWPAIEAWARGIAHELRTARTPA